MSTIVQRSFAGGEIAPALFARVDTSKYASGARDIRNHMVMRHGGLSNRPGTSFVGEVKDSTALPAISKIVRFIPFIFSVDIAYVVEVGDSYFRFVRDGNQVLETSIPIVSVTQANPAVVTATAHGYSNGDEVVIRSGVSMTELDDKNFLVTAATANTFELTSRTGVVVNSTAFAAYTAGGDVSRVYTLVTPYAAADLRELQFVQADDTLTIAHANYPVQELTIVSSANWTLTPLDVAPSIDRPGGMSIVSYTPSTPILGTYWLVTAIKEGTYEESFAAYEASTAFSAITAATPAVVTSVGHAYQTGDEVIILSAGAGGPADIVGEAFIITVLTANTYSLNNSNRTGLGTTGGGTIARVYLEIFGNYALPTLAAPITITWGLVSDAVQYNVYRASNGIFGLIGVSSNGSFIDIGVDPDTTVTPPNLGSPFDTAGNYPSVVSYTQQRRAFSATDNDPEMNWLSRTGKFTNFTVSSPIQDDDAVSFSLSGRQFNQVMHLLDVGQLVMFTSTGEWVVEGDANGIISPESINPKQYSNYGSSSIPPLMIGSKALYVQARGGVVRDFGFEFQIDGYRGNDLTLFATHLFENFTLLDWAYQQIPNSIVWAVRSDGVLLGLTYVQEQQICAWHHHDFGGTVESVCVVPEALEDAVYLVILRTIGGVTRRFIERLNTRVIDDIVDYVGMDSALSFDGRNDDGVTTMTLSGGTTWAYDETLTLTCSNIFFTAAMVDDFIQLTGSDGELIRFEIKGFTSDLIVTGKPNRTVPASLQATATVTWAHALRVFSGLDHLEGEAVSVFGDGFVVASPNNAEYDIVTVTDGSITLPEAYAVVHVGVPITADLETLDADTAQGETIADKKKNVGKLSIYVEKSRGIFAGGNPPTDDEVDPLEGLYELKVRNGESQDEPVNLATGLIDIILQPEWSSHGRVFVRQVDPVPLSILGLAAAGSFPFKG